MLCHPELEWEFPLQIDAYIPKSSHHPFKNDHPYSGSGAWPQFGVEISTLIDAMRRIRYRVVIVEGVVGGFRNVGIDLEWEFPLQLRMAKNQNRPPL